MWRVEFGVNVKTPESVDFDFNSTPQTQNSKLHQITKFPSGANFNVTVFPLNLGVEPHFFVLRSAIYYIIGMNTQTKHSGVTLCRSLAAVVFAFMALALMACSSGGADEKADAAAGGETAPLVPPIQLIAGADTLYDLYIMSMCPYGFSGLSDLMDLTRAFPQRKWNVWFIGRVNGDRISSLRGEPEIFDETLWLGVKALYPSRYHDFLKRRAEPGKPTLDLLKEMKFDVEKVRQWADNHGRDTLRQHYTRGNDLNVNASPSLFINNNRYNGRVGGGWLVRDRCRAADPVPQLCKDYPECSEDTDCQMRGKLGKCAKTTEKGKERAVCEYRDDVPFTLTVLVADSAMDSPEGQIIGWVERMLPGVKVNNVKFSTEDGKRLMGVHNPSALPFFHFEKAVEGAYQFSSVLERLEAAADGGYQLGSGAARTNYFTQRQEKPGLIELYADPLMPNVGQMINVVLSSPDFAGRVTLRPATLTNQREPPALDRLRMEEALRWIVLADEFPGGYNAYLKRYAENPASSFWVSWLKDANVNQDRFLRSTGAGQAKMASYRADFAAITSGEPAMLMINNRTKVQVANERELERALRSVIR